MIKEVNKAIREYYIALAIVVLLTINNLESNNNSRIITLPIKHSIYTCIFLEKESRTLTPFNKYIYTINLNRDIVLLYSPIYSLTKPELKVFREYLNNTIKKG